MAAGDFSDKTVRHAFLERERGRCFRCGRPLRFEGRGWQWSAHHRIPRGSGGIGAKKGSPYELLISGITNCLILCGSGTTGCHGWVEKWRDIARDEGYLIPRLGIERDPGGIRIKRKNGTWWLLTSSGLAVECEKGIGE